MTRDLGLKLYIWFIGALGLAALAYGAILFSWLHPAPSPQTLIGAVLFVIFGVISSHRQVSLGESAKHMMGTVAYVATVILFPFPIALVALGLSKVISEALFYFEKQRRLRHIAVNTGATVLSLAIAGVAFHALGGEPALWQHDLRALEALPAVASLGVLYYFIETAVVVGAISLSNAGDTPWNIYRKVFGEAYRGEFSLIFVGIILGIMCHFSPVVSVFLVVPVLWSIRAFESVALLRQETIDSVLKMAESIDYRDTGTYEHSQRIADLTRRLAKSLSLIPEEVDEIVLASRVHDLGKIGISNEILLKEGPLTEEERRTMQDHPIIGAEILSQYSAFQRSSEIVKHHHERWDGRGYPDGLKGSEIPVGSRIIAVVDAFDAMTADRTYRTGMAADVAVERLKAAMGSQFDPRICAAFIQLLIEDGKYVPRELSHALHVVGSERSAS